MIYYSHTYTYAQYTIRFWREEMGVIVYKSFVLQSMHGHQDCIFQGNRHMFAELIILSVTDSYRAQPLILLSQ